MNPHPPPLSSPIQEKIVWAEECCQNLGDSLLADDEVVRLLDRLQGAIRDSHAVMVNSGLVDICRACDELEGGSCCGRGLENRYDGWLLLINLLLGVKLPAKSQDDRSCFFLGKTGCKLLARHVLCINYMCKKITDTIPKKAIQNLREKEGEEVTALFLINERIKSILLPQIGSRSFVAHSP